MTSQHSSLSVIQHVDSPAQIVASRIQEKRELQDLNERLANYIESARFLEFHNKKLAGDIEFYKGKLENLDRVIRQIFETEIKQARELVDDNEKERKRLEEKQDKLERDNNQLQSKHEDLESRRDSDFRKLLELEDKLAEKLARINALQRKINILEEEIARLKKEYNRLYSLVNETKLKHDEELQIRHDLEAKIPMLEEEIETKQKMHEQELRDLLESLMKDDTDLYRNIFHSELSKALREIRKEYEEQLNKRPDNEVYYQQKIQEIIKTTAKKTQDELQARDNAQKDRAKEAELRKEISILDSRGDALRRRIKELERILHSDKEDYDTKLRDRDSKINLLKKKLEDMHDEMQNMTDEKLRLDSEISKYRQLLSGEEQRMQDRLTEVQRSVREGHVTESTYQTLESNVRQSIVRKASGPIAIAEANLNEKFIILENTTYDQDVKLDGWKVERGTDQRDQQTLATFNKDTILRPGRTHRVNVPAWSGSTSKPVVTTLVNNRGDEQAVVTVTVQDR